MIKLLKHGPCRILSFPSLFNWKIEIVWAPKDYTIDLHSHPSQDIELVILWGKDVLLRRIRGADTDTHISKMPQSIFKKFSIRAGDLHDFSTGPSCFLFLNIEHWHSKPTSAALDFNYAK
jgi:hypothetical protein